MTSSVPVKICFGWFLFALLFMVLSVAIWEPMAGLLFAMGFCALALMIGGPVIHLTANRFFFSGRNKYWAPVSAAIALAILGIFAAAITSGFLGGT